MCGWPAVATGCGGREPPAAGGAPGCWNAGMKKAIGVTTPDMQRVSVSAGTSFGCAGACTGDCITLRTGEGLACTSTLCPARLGAFSETLLLTTSSSDPSKAHRTLTIDSFTSRMVHSRTSLPNFASAMQPTCGRHACWGSAGSSAGAGAAPRGAEAACSRCRSARVAAAAEAMSFSACLRAWTCSALLARSASIAIFHSFCAASSCRRKSWLTPVLH
mmetsp:Transcript_6285/g.17745  ORF Transcript_6285/g.17745 Transcript_6285/m.17745 type:complete len:218 (-) Transcript_6285:377-1030(-)